MLGGRPHTKLIFPKVDASRSQNKRVRDETSGGTPDVGEGMMEQERSSKGLYRYRGRCTDHLWEQGCATESYVYTKGVAMCKRNRDKQWKQTSRKGNKRLSRQSHDKLEHIVTQ